MRLLSLCILAACATASADPREARPLSPACVKAWRTLRASQLKEFQKEKAPDHVVAAFNAAAEVLQERATKQPFRRTKFDDSFVEEWPIAFPSVQMEVGSREAPVATTTLTRKTKVLGQRFEEQGKSYFFRPMDDRSVRVRFAADKVNELLGIDSSPSSFFGKLNGQLGLISEWTPGETHRGVENEAAFVKEAIASGKLDERSVSDAQAFMFLVLDYDASLGNAAIDSRGKVRIFDHDRAFDDAFPQTGAEAGVIYGLQGKLPDRYTPQFLDGLRKLTPEIMKNELGDYLSPNELRRLRFQREVILQDVRLRGPSAIYSAPTPRDK